MGAWSRRPFEFADSSCKLAHHASAQQVERRLVLLACIIFRDRLLEDRIVGHGGKQRHRRAKFEVIGRAEDGPDRLAFDAKDEARAFAKAGPEDVMRKIGGGLLTR